MRFRRRVALGALALLLAASGLVAASLGPAGIPLGRTGAILLHGLGLGGRGGWPEWQSIILMDVRLPRVIVAALAGGALAVAGAVMQSLFRNPMADPGILGVSQGAALGSVAALYTGLAFRSVFWLPALGFAGALACAFLVYAVASRAGRTSMTTLLLSGIALGGIAAALTAFLLSIALDNYEIGRELILWLMGVLEGRTWLHVRLCAPLVVGGSVWLFLRARELNLLLSGEESALALGVDVPGERRNLLVLASLVTAASVSVTGVVGFVGLMVPHILRAFTGPDHRMLLPACFLGGGSFLILADLLCRTALPQEELRLGMVTALIGGFFFLALLLRRRRELETL